MRSHHDLEQSRAEQSRAEQSRAEQSRAEQSRAEEILKMALEIACQKHCLVRHDKVMDHRELRTTKTGQADYDGR